MPAFAAWPAVLRRPRWRNEGADCRFWVALCSSLNHCGRQSARTGPRRGEHDDAGGDFSAADGSHLSGVWGIGTRGQLSVRPYYGVAFFSTPAVADAAEQGFQGRWSTASPREFCLIVCYGVWPTEQRAGRRLGAPLRFSRQVMAAREPRAAS